MDINDMEQNNTLQDNCDTAAANGISDEDRSADNVLCPACSSRHKLRSDEDKKALLTRLRKIEGQIRGLEKMVENDAYCPDILIQVSAATSALNSFSKVLLNSHIHSCVAEDIREGNDETIDELCSLLQKLMK